ncbi:hypothetical protein [Streptomyces sp. NPDC058955]|uniref:hypothetical protein n=1 Tax=unclassified Streptomyces TaxID=2593676 RepID=UPI003664EB14
MPSSFESSANDVYEAAKALRTFKNEVRSVVENFEQAVRQYPNWFGYEGEDEFANIQGPIHRKTVDSTRKALLALTETFEALADGTMRNADAFVNHQADVVTSIRQQNDAQNGPRG